jgi:non-specific serine/threonine protein kinase
MGSVASPERYRFGAFELQLDERRLLSDGASVLLRPRAFDLLAALVERAGHLLTKDELFDRVWPGVVVEEAALHVQVSALRKVLGADAIATVSGQGYRFALPVTKVEPRGKHNLPSQLTSFIGREQEIAQLKELLTTNRLVTLTGAGGAGKTRLAIEVAGSLLDAFADGVCLVELAALSDPQLVPQAVAEVLEVKVQPGKSPTETVCGYLASRNLLLVLDNAEHLLDACVQFADQASRRSTRLTILVTSRERLGMAGELTYRVPSLTVPAPTESAAPQTVQAYESVRLFVERARLLRPDFTITDGNAAAVASICYRLDGIPLAIELAAPRLRSMSIEELNRRLDLRFALLTEGSRADLPRHRTLRSMIDWSYDLLSEAEQAMLRRVAVSAGGWTLSRAEDICSGDGIESTTVLELLTSLVDKSLVLSDERDGATRYRMLETVRQYALDRLRKNGEQAQWQARHLASFLALAEEHYDARGAKWRGWIDELADEYDNMRAALGWCVAAKLPEGLRLATALKRFWAIRARNTTEGREWHARLLESVPKDIAVRDRAWALNGAGMLAQSQGDCAAAEPLFRQSLAISREINERRLEAHGLTGLAMLAMDRAQYAEAEPLLVECVALARSAGDRPLVAIGLSNLAIVAHARGDTARAFQAFEEALTIGRDIGNERLVSQILVYKGRAACKEGMVPLADESLVESLTIAKELGAALETAKVLETFAELALAKHAPERAARICGAAEHVREEIAAPISFDEQADYQRTVAAARTVLGDDAFDEARREGREMTLEEAVKYALSGEDTPQRHSPHWIALDLKVRFRAKRTSAQGCEFNWSAQHILNLRDATASTCQICANRKERCFLDFLTRAFTASDRR